MFRICAFSCNIQLRTLIIISKISIIRGDEEINHSKFAYSPMRPFSLPGDIVWNTEGIWNTVLPWYWFRISSFSVYATLNFIQNNFRKTIKQSGKSQRGYGFDTSRIEFFFLNAWSLLMTRSFVWCVEGNPCSFIYSLTHWGRVTYIWVSKLTTSRRQSIIGTNAGIFLIGP